MKKKTIIAIVAIFVVVMFAGCFDSTPNSATPSSALLIDNATQGSGNIVITHHGGDTIRKAFKETAPFWDSLEVRINDDICTGSVTLNGKPVSSGDFKPKDVLSISLSKNLESDNSITVVYKPTGKLLHRAKISSLTTPSQLQKAELSLGESVIVNNISFAVVEYEFADSFIDGFNRTRSPKEGAKFLWLYVKATNIGEVAQYIPEDHDVFILYKGTEIIYYTGWGSKEREMYAQAIGLAFGKIYPDVSEEGWIIYEVPKGIDLSQAKVRVEFPSKEGYYGQRKTMTWNFAS